MQITLELLPEPEFKERALEGVRRRAATEMHQAEQRFQKVVIDCEVF
jgi:hypothetical protein